MLHRSHPSVWSVVFRLLLVIGLSGGNVIHAAAPVDDVAAVEITARATWGARKPSAGLSTWESYGLEVPPYTLIVLHVTSMGHGAGAAEARRVQNFQMDGRGFADIAYNYLVDSAGAVFEGRSLTVVPAHAGRSIEADRNHDIRLDPDYGAIGIVFTAETDDELTEAQVAAGTRLVAFLQARHPIEAVLTHAEVGPLLESRGLTPRGDYAPEQCPGHGTIEGIVRLRSQVDPDFDPARYRRLFGNDRPPG